MLGRRKSNMSSLYKAVQRDRKNRSAKKIKIEFTEDYIREKRRKTRRLSIRRARIAKENLS
jgi:hypothetical protein